jgi:hypothetical protein
VSGDRPAGVRSAASQVAELPSAHRFVAGSSEHRQLADLARQTASERESDRSAAWRAGSISGFRPMPGCGYGAESSSDGLS